MQYIIVSDKLKSEGRANKTLIYSETAGSMEKLAVLRAWAEVYIEAVSHEMRSKELDKHGSSSGGAGRDTESLLDLVKPELRELARLWIAILRDHALLSLSSGVCNCHCMQYNENRIKQHTMDFGDNTLNNLAAQYRYNMCIV